MIVGSITVDCTDGEIDPMTNAFLQMSAVFAELELRIIRARVKSGMANAKAKGARIGRPPLTKDDIKEIASILLSGFAKRAEENNIELTFEDSVIDLKLA